MIYDKIQKMDVVGTMKCVSEHFIQHSTGRNMVDYLYLRQIFLWTRSESRRRSRRWGPVSQFVRHGPKGSRKFAPLFWTESTQSSNNNIPTILIYRYRKAFNLHNLRQISSHRKEYNRGYWMGIIFYHRLTEPRPNKTQGKDGALKWYILSFRKPLLPPSLSRLQFFCSDLPQTRRPSRKVFRQGGRMSEVGGWAGPHRVPDYFLPQRSDREWSWDDASALGGTQTQGPLPGPGRTSLVGQRPEAETQMGAPLRHTQDVSRLTLRCHSLQTTKGWHGILDGVHLFLDSGRGETLRSVPRALPSHSARHRTTIW